MPINIREIDYTGSEDNLSLDYTVLVFGPRPKKWVWDKPGEHELQPEQDTENYRLFKSLTEWNDYLKLGTDDTKGSEAHEEYVNKLDSSGNLQFNTWGDAGKKYITNKANFGFLTASECLRYGLSVLYVFDDIFTYSNDKITSTFDMETFADKGRFNLRFITGGSIRPEDLSKTTVKYGSDAAMPLDKALLEIAAERGDCTALIDEEGLTTEIESRVNGMDETGHHTTPLYQYAAEKIIAKGTDPSWTRSEVRGKYGRIWAPYGLMEVLPFVFDLTADGQGNGYWSKDLISLPDVPASLAFLCTFGYWVITNPVKTYNPWYAIAGSERGVCPNKFIPNHEYGDADIKVLQTRAPEKEGHIAVNVVSKVEPFGYILYGNRTMLPLSAPENGKSKKVQLVASSYANIRELCNSIKKVAYQAARKYTFEPNNLLLWFKYRNELLPILETAKNDNGCKDYEVTPKDTKMKALLLADINIIKPIEGVEDFDLTMGLFDDEQDLQFIEE